MEALALAPRHSCEKTCFAPFECAKASERPKASSGSSVGAQQILPKVLGSLRPLVDRVGGVQSRVCHLTHKPYAQETVAPLQAWACCGRREEGKAA